MVRNIISASSEFTCTGDHDILVRKLSGSTIMNTHNRYHNSIITGSMSYQESLEKRIEEIALELRELMGVEAPNLFNLRRWQGRVMASAMRNRAFKVSLFRFIDLLPTLKEDDLIVRMLYEYFSGLEDAPLIVRRGSKRISEHGTLAHIAARIIRSALNSLAGQFIPVIDIGDAAVLLEDIRKNGFSFSVDLLGEEVLSSKEAQLYALRYRELMDLMAPMARSWKAVQILDHDDSGPIPRFDISLKVSSLYSQLDPADWLESIKNTRAGLGMLIDKAMDCGASITLDMERYYHKGLTIAIFMEILEGHGDFQFGGIALQAYLRETKEDLLSLIEWSKSHNKRVTVRLVKGAYWDYETAVSRQNGWPVPVFLHKEETDRNFEDLTSILLENIEYVRPAIATHNIRSISHAIAAADSLGLQREAFEFQMIYGMAEPVRRALQAKGYRIRLYTPIGKLIPGMAYLIRRLLENTSNGSFLRRAFFELEPLAVLIKPPLQNVINAEEHEIQEQEVHVFRNEPLLDFSLSENRQDMKIALEKVRTEFGGHHPLLIGDRQVMKERKIVSINPACPEEVVGIVSSGNKEDAERTIAGATIAWSTWRKTEPDERAEYLFRASKVMRTMRFELAALEVYEVGKSWKEADADVAEAIDYVEYYAYEMIRLGKPRPLGNYQGELNDYVYEPKGVGVVISPWNFPLAIPAGMVSASIVTGNAVIFKPSGLSPVLGWKLVDIFRQAGLPSGVLQFLPGPGREVGEYLVSHPGTDFVAFTGSKDVGLRIVKLAGTTRPGQRNVKRVVAEMGGKNAIIIDETADLDEAVKGVVDSAFSFQGQKCSACSRVIVVGEMHDEFCGRLRDAAESIIIGPPEDPHNTMGPLVDEAALKKVKRYIRIAKKEGKPLLVRKAKGDGYFVGPAIFTDVNPESRIGQEEIFGPVVAIMRAKDIDEALSIANGVPYALTGGIFSRSPANIEKAKKEFRVGNLYINRKITGALVGRQPFGGFGMSGVGSKAGGPDYLLQFMNPKSICENTLRRGFAPAQKI